MPRLQLGEVTLSRVVQIPRSFFPTRGMLPDSTLEAIERHYPYPAHAARTARVFFERHADTGVLVLPAHLPCPGYIVRATTGHRFEPAAEL